MRVETESAKRQAREVLAVARCYRCMDKVNTVILRFAVGLPLHHVWFGRRSQSLLTYSTMANSTVLHICYTVYSVTVRMSQSQLRS